MRNLVSFRGGIVDHARERHFTFESLLERHFLHIALDRDDVAEIVEQSPRVFIMGLDGQPIEHVFDCAITLTDGRRLAIDLKPRSLVARSGIEALHRLIREQHGTKVADLYLVRTEEHLHPADVWDARWKARARRLPDPAADAAVMELLPYLLAWCPLDDVVRQVGMEGAGFNAAVRAIGSGLLEVRDRACISYRCLVRRARPAVPPCPAGET